jgi:N-carbamoylputrescine amidase
MTTSVASGTVTLGLVQMSCTDQPQANMQKAVQGIRDAAKRGAQIICLQELFLSRFQVRLPKHWGGLRLSWVW